MASSLEEAKCSLRHKLPIENSLRSAKRFIVGGLWQLV